MKDRLKEPSSYAGLGLVFNGIINVYLVTIRQAH